MMNAKSTILLRLALISAVFPLACDSLLDVESPGQIIDEDLNNPSAVTSIVRGMKYDLSDAMDEMGEEVAIFTGDLWHGGSYAWANIPRGTWPEEDVGDVWNAPQQARWVAENGIETIREILGDEVAGNADVAEAYLYAGFSNRLLGENFCSSVIDGQAEIPNTEHFPRALDQFSQAIEHAQATELEDIETAAYAGRAQIKLDMGDYAGAAADAEQVPADFEFMAEIDIELRNELVYETHTRFEYTVYSTQFEDHPDDPRAPWTIVRNADGTVANGANGSTPHYQQLKYTESASDIPLAKGTEMLLIRAEAALRDGNVDGAYALMNQARAVYEMDPLEVGSEATAWEDLQYERRATNWLELRAMWDLRRFFDEGRNDFLADRDKCVPINEEERRANDNIP